MSRLMDPVFYNDPSFNYQKYWRKRLYENEAERIVLRRIFRLTNKKESILDIGGGFGRLAPEYCPYFKKCVLIDPSQKLLAQAKKLCSQYKNLTVIKSRIENLPLNNRTFDAVLLVRILHHLFRPETAIKEIYRILKPSGYLILEFANKVHAKNCLRALLRLNFNFFTKHTPEDIGHQEGTPPFFNYHPNQIKTLLLSEGFEIIKTYSVSNFRHPLIKKIIPGNLLLFLEKLLQEPLASVNFGPSIFVLAQKPEK